ncbi:MAG: hypothetical protein V4590_05285 [Bacteroidota bacterium]
MIKKILFIFLSIGVVTSLFAQGKLSEGKVLFGVTYPELSGEMEGVKDMLPKELTVYFKKEQSRTEMPSSVMGKLITINNTQTGELMMMMELMGNKLAVKQTKAELKKQELAAEQEGLLPVISVIKLDGTKMIAGYECKKAIVEVKEKGEIFRSECFYTDKLPKMKDQNDRLFKDLDGFIMEYSQKQSGIKMTITAKVVIKQKVADQLFTISPDYKLVTQKELEKMVSGLSGK